MHAHALRSLTYLFLSLVCAPSGVAAQIPSYAWSLGLGGTSGDEGRAVAMDAAGNVYVAGTFASTVDFGGGPLTSTGSGDVFLAKFTPGGAHVWSRNFGGTSSDFANGIAVNPDGRVAITGSFWGTANFGGGAPLVSTGTANVFVACYDAGGGHLWSRGFGGASSGNHGRAVAIDEAGNVVVTGFIGGPADLGGGSLAVSGAADAFLAKYDAAGAHQWSVALGGTGTEIGNAVAFDATGHVLLAGQFNGTGNFGGANLTSAGLEDLFLARYDGAGAHQWSQRFGNQQNCIARGVATDAAGNAVVTGHFTGVVDFGGGSLNAFLGTNVLLAKYDTAGNHVWSRGFGASSTTDIGYGVAIDAWDRIVLTGYFEGTADFGGGPLTSGGSHDILVARYDAAGGHEWSVGFGTTAYQEGRDIAVDPSGNIVATGIFANAVDFGDGWMVPAGGNDAYLLKFDGSPPTGVAVTRPGGDLPVLAAYPNPFRTATTIECVVPRGGRASITIHDARGARIVTLHDGDAAGTIRRVWSGRDDAGRRVVPGVYFARVAGPAGTGSVKVVRLE